MQANVVSRDKQTDSANEGSLQQIRKPSAKKVETNRRNAQKSTGPKTERGKANVRFNALKHGFLAEQVLLFSSSDEYTVFAELLQALCQHFKPEGSFEEICVQQVAICLRRERQGWRWEIAEEQHASLFITLL